MRRAARERASRKWMAYIRSRCARSRCPTLDQRKGAHRCLSGTYGPVPAESPFFRKQADFYLEIATTARGGAAATKYRAPATSDCGQVWSLCPHLGSTSTGRAERFIGMSVAKRCSKGRPVRTRVSVHGMSVFRYHVGITLDCARGTPVLRMEILEHSTCSMLEHLGVVRPHRAGCCAIFCPTRYRRKRRKTLSVM